MALPQPSGSAKIYATASKEWVIPPKLKPGRKPKAIPQDDLEFAENDTTEQGKKSQNRSAQRAFRERRQTQLSELQARIKQYERGEVERSVTLQALGIRLKAENDTLKEQNSTLKEENDRLKARLDSCTCNHSAAVASFPGPSSATPRRGTKRSRAESPPMSTISLKRLKIADSPPPHQLASSLNTPSYDSTSPITDNGNSGQDACIAEYSCGMCTSSTDCICRQLGIETPIADPSLDHEDDNPMSILNNLPPYQPAVPLPRHAKPSLPGLDTVMSTTATKQEGGKPDGCSGDPRNCSACRDSAFGRAFCSALGNSVCMLNPCPTCQSKSTEKSNEMEVDDVPQPLTVNPSLTQCCGDPAHCKGGACTPTAPSTPSTRSTKRGKPVTQERLAHRIKSQLPHMITTADGDTVSCDVVWRALEAHPNAHLANPAAGPSHLANLNLLADVVARRSYCTLAPGEPTPEPEDFPRRARSRPRPSARTKSRPGKAIAHDVAADAKPANARVAIEYEDDQTMDMDLQQRTMVPREVLQGHQRITAVPTEGMRDAIALLDQQFGCS